MTSYVLFEHILVQLIPSIMFRHKNGLKPFTKHYHYLDSGIPDIFPKVVEIEMTSGTFTVYEDATIFKNGKEIGKVRAPEISLLSSHEQRRCRSNITFG